MGYAVELEGADLRCRSREAAERAAEIIGADPWIHPYHLRVSPVCHSKPPNDASWSLEVHHFQGDHWHSEEAQRVWLAIASCMADGATLEFQDGYERFRIRWEAGRVFEDHVSDVIWSMTSEITAPATQEIT